MQHSLAELLCSRTFSMICMALGVINKLYCHVRCLNNVCIRVVLLCNPVKPAGVTQRNRTEAAKYVKGRLKYKNKRDKM